MHPYTANQLPMNSNFGYSKKGQAEIGHKDVNINRIGVHQTNSGALGSQMYQPHSQLTAH
jgi:hypothetical protein